MPLELFGRITHITAQTSGEGRNGTWIKQGFTIRYGDEYEKDTFFTLFGDAKIAMLDACQKGDRVKVTFTSESRQDKNDEDKWYSENKAYRLENLDNAERRANPSAEHIAEAKAATASTAVETKAAPAASKPAAKATPPEAKQTAMQPSQSFEEQAGEESDLPF